MIVTKGITASVLFPNHPAEIVLKTSLVVHSWML